MNTKKIQITFLIAGLVFSALACNLPAAVIKNEVTVVPTLQPAEQLQLENQIATQIVGAVSGSKITVELTESQLTSLINNQAPNIQDAQISGIQVTLDNNQAQFQEMQLLAAYPEISTWYWLSQQTHRANRN